MDPLDYGTLHDSFLRTAARWPGRPPTRCRRCAAAPITRTAWSTAGARPPPRSRTCAAATPRPATASATGSRSCSPSGLVLLPLLRPQRARLSVVPINRTTARTRSLLMDHSKPAWRSRSRAARPSCGGRPQPRRPFHRGCLRGPRRAAARGAHGGGRGRAGRRHRGGAPLHLRHHRPAQGLHPHQRVLPHLRQLVPVARRRWRCATASSACTTRCRCTTRTASRSRPRRCCCGGCLAFPDRFHASTWWKDLVACRVTAVHIQGIIPNILLKLPPCAEERAHEALRALRRDRAQPPRAVRAPLRPAGGRDVGDVRDRPLPHRQPRAAPDRHRAFGRAVPGRGADRRRADEEVPPGVPGELVVRHRAEAPRKGFLLGLPQEPGGDRGSVAQRLVPHRRQRAARRGHVHLPRPQEEHHPPRRREHRRGRGRGLPHHPTRCAGSR